MSYRGKRIWILKILYIKRERESYNFVLKSTLCWRSLVILRWYIIFSCRRVFIIPCSPCRNYCNMGLLLWVWIFCPSGIGNSLSSCCIKWRLWSGVQPNEYADCIAINCMRLKMVHLLALSFLYHIAVLIFLRFCDIKIAFTHNDKFPVTFHP